jgi:hypothetical protein
MLPFPMLLSWPSSSCPCRCRASARPFRLPSQNRHPELRGVPTLPSVFSVCQLSAVSCQSFSPRAPRDLLLASPKSPHQYHSMGLTLPLFSYSYALFCTARSAISNRFIPFHTLSAKHPGWVYPMIALSAKLLSPFSCYPAPNPFRIRTSAKHAGNSCGIRTSKTQDLKPFRIRTYEKPQGGPPPMPNQSSSRGTPACASSVGQPILAVALQLPTRESPSNVYLASSPLRAPRTLRLRVILFPLFSSLFCPARNSPSRYAIVRWQRFSRTHSDPSLRRSRGKNG